MTSDLDARIRELISDINFETGGNLGGELEELIEQRAQLAQTGTPEEFTGHLGIIWPPCRDGAAAMPGFAVQLFDANTGEPITSALDVTLRLNSREIVTAELTMLTDAEGRPLAHAARPVWDSAAERALTGHFRWRVTEMRIADPT